MNPKLSKKKLFMLYVMPKYRSDRWLGVCVFEAMGPSKNAYFEDVFKMAKKLLKMPKNGPKMIQKWFKIAQIA